MKLSEIKNGLVLDSEHIEKILKRTYIPFYEKQVIQQHILNASTYDIDGFTKVDVLDNQLAIDLKFITEYFDIENDLDFNELIELYDLLNQKNIINKMKNFVGEDWIYFESKLKEAIKLNLEDIRNQYLQENSIENQLKNFLNDLITKLPDDKKILSLVKSLKKEFNGFKWEKNSVLGKVAKEYANVDLPSKENIEKTLDIVNTVVNKPEAPKNKEAYASGKVKK